MFVPVLVIFFLLGGGLGLYIGLYCHGLLGESGVETFLWAFAGRFSHKLLGNLGEYLGTETSIEKMLTLIGCGIA